MQFLTVEKTFIFLLLCDGLCIVPLTKFVMMFVLLYCINGLHFISLFVSDSCSVGTVTVYFHFLPSIP